MFFSECLFVWGGCAVAPFGRCRYCSPAGPTRASGADPAAIKQKQEFRERFLERQKRAASVDAGSKDRRVVRGELRPSGLKTDTRGNQTHLMQPRIGQSRGASRERETMKKILKQPWADERGRL